MNNVEIAERQRAESTYDQTTTMENLMLFQINKTSEGTTKDEDQNESNTEEKIFLLAAKEEKFIMMMKRMKMEKVALELQLTRVNTFYSSHSLILYDNFV